MYMLDVYTGQLDVYTGQLDVYTGQLNNGKDLSQWMIQRTVIRPMKWFRVGSTGGLFLCVLFIVYYWQFPDVVTVTFPILITV